MEEEEEDLGKEEEEVTFPFFVGGLGLASILPFILIIPLLPPQGNHAEGKNESHQFPPPIYRKANAAGQFDKTPLRICVNFFNDFCIGKFCWCLSLVASTHGTQ